MSFRYIVLVAVLIFLALNTGCEEAVPTPTPVPPSITPSPGPATATPVLPTATPTPAPAMDLTSPAFVPGESIPTKYTCDGDDISPLLRWSDPPPGTQSFVLVVDDPDASSNTWVHWVIYNLPAETRSLPEAFPSDVELPDGSRHGSNSWGRPGYGGPCPPSGERAHRYYFKLYALDIVLDLAAGATKDQVFHAARGHILAETKMKGLYARQ